MDYSTLIDILGSTIRLGIPLLLARVRSEFDIAEARRLR